VDWWLRNINLQTGKTEVIKEVKKASYEQKIFIIPIIIIIIIIDVSCHMPFLPGNSLEPTVIPTAQASSFTLQYFPYYV
jgi:hypothetical protein